MKATNLPGFTAEQSLNRTKGQFHAIASDAYMFEVEIRPQLHCVEKDGEIACTGGGGFGRGFTDWPAGAFPKFPFDHTFAQCRARCYQTTRGAALKSCLSDC